MKLGDAFEPLEPPAGGLTRLRARLASPRPSRWRTPVFALASLAIAAVVIVRWTAPDEVDLIGELRRNGAGVVVGLDAPNVEPVVLQPGQAAGLQRLPSHDPQVLLYRLAVLDASMTPPAD